MPSEINSDPWWWRVRMWLATKIAPLEVSLRDDRYVCACQEELLEAVLYHWLRQREDGEDLAPVGDQLCMLEDFGVVERDEHFAYRLTVFGERELARLWGPAYRPPWVGGWAACQDHGVYDCGPGEPWECPYCVLDRELGELLPGPATGRPWWSRLTPRNRARNTL